jgi:hypothetical protein
MGRTRIILLALACAVLTTNIEASGIITLNSYPFKQIQSYTTAIPPNSTFLKDFILLTSPGGVKIQFYNLLDNTT